MQRPAAAAPGALSRVKASVFGFGLALAIGPDLAVASAGSASADPRCATASASSPSCIALESPAKAPGIVLCQAIPNNGSYAAGSAVYGVSFGTAAHIYLTQVAKVRPAGTASVTILEPPKHGKLVSADNADFIYAPRQGFLGNDRVVAMVRLDRRNIRVVYQLKVVDRNIGSRTQDEVCGRPGFWRIGAGTLSSVPGRDTAAPIAVAASAATLARALPPVRVGVCKPVSISGINVGWGEGLGVVGVLQNYIEKSERRKLLLPPSTVVRLIRAPRHGHFVVEPPDVPGGWPGYSYHAPKGFEGKDSFTVQIVVGGRKYQMTYFLRTVLGDTATSRICGSSSGSTIWKISSHGQGALAVSDGFAPAA